ncbi:MAG TPA: hypothetical protein VKS01_03870, partial [Bryobacteraceae bacterium]|nr:hypothetical protein [Bryobacteraceae bacterium]
HPDLEGIWTNVTRTPLERPDDFRGKPFLTEPEATAYEHRILTQGDRDRRDGSAEADVARAYNQLFFDQGDKLSRIEGRIPTSLIFDPPDGRIPALTPEAEARIARQRAYARLHPADRAQDRSLTERCIYWATAGPPMLPGPYNNLYQIYQTRDRVTILSEMIHEARIIPLDGGPHVASPIRLWTGDSRGHWDGDTLVVETTNFNSKTQYRGSTENLKVTERLRRVDAKTILYSFTIDDPATFTKPWSAELPLAAAAGPIYEYACHEGNQALIDILAGARAEERKSSGR